MILHALKDYYDRKAADPNSGIAPPGFEWKEIPYIIVLNDDGIPVNIEETREGEGKKQRAKRFLVPKPVKRASGIIANFLWDTPVYALGIWVPDPKKDTKKSPEESLKRAKDQHDAFVEKANQMLDSIQTPSASAIRKFLSFSDKASLLKGFPNFETMINEGANLTFQLHSHSDIILRSTEIVSAIEREFSQDSAKKQLCIISGNTEPTKRLHDPIKGVMGAQVAGANIVSFNLSAFRSFGKEQGANSPIGQSTAFAYVEALNSMLGKDSNQRMLVGDSTTVFWAAKEEDKELEESFTAFFSEPPKDDPDRNVEAVKSLFKSIENGVYLDTPSDRRFYILGLAPNASRISIRFWHHGTVAETANNIAKHFRDLEICHGPKEKDYLSLFRLLVSVATQGKSENIPPNLAGDTMRAILAGLPYPKTLLQAAVRRNRAEQHVSYQRAALIKACLNRQAQFQNNQKEVIHVSLDLENTNIGYRLGRLFATLEKIQEESRNPKGAEKENGSTSTIRDRYYGAASSTPIAVFASLMKLKNHHLAKLEKSGRRIYFEKLIGEIVSVFARFPTNLSLDDQGRFAIGYYHQKNDFYTSKSNNTSTEKEEQ